MATDRQGWRSDGETGQGNEEARVTISKAWKEGDTFYWQGEAPPGRAGYVPATVPPGHKFRLACGEKLPEDLPKQKGTDGKILSKEVEGMSEYVTRDSFEAHLQRLDEKIDAKVDQIHSDVQSVLNEMRVRDEAHLQEMRLRDDERKEDVKAIREDLRSMKGEITNLKNNNKGTRNAIWGVFVAVVAMVIAVIYSNTQIVGTIAQIVSK